MLKLYQFEGCPYCRIVRQKLSDMEMTYISVCVPADRSQRDVVVRVSGQPFCNYGQISRDRCPWPLPASPTRTW